MQNVWWWGTDDFVFCAECYDELHRDSYFATNFKYQGTLDVRPEACCDMWSDEMRQAYFDAFQNQTLAEFVAFARQWQEEDTQSRSAQAVAQIQATIRYTQAPPQQFNDQSYSQAQTEGSLQKRSKLGMAVHILAGAVKAGKKVKKRSRFGKAVNVLAEL